MANGEVTLTFTGNSFFQDKISGFTDTPFIKLVDLLRKSDVSFTNLECAIHNGEPFPAHVGAGRVASYLAAPPLVVEELKWMGIKMVYAANNHAHNFAEKGVTTTINYLNQGGLAYAGIGPSLAAATAPAYYQTSRGLVGLVAAADWGPRGIGHTDLPFQTPNGALAADGNNFFKARPGVNLLRYDTVNTLDQQGIDALRRMSKEWGWDEAKERRRAGAGRDEPFLSQSIFNCEQDTDAQFYFMGRKFALSDTFDFYTEPYKEDLDRNYQWIKEAKKNADWVVSALHDQGSRRSFDEEHVRIFAHGSIDAGADVFVAHGARHGGVEIYKGKVILYGLPPFYFLHNTIRNNPPELMARYGLSPTSTGAEFLEARTQGEGRALGEAARRTEAGAGSVIHQVVYDEQRKLKEVRVIPLERQSAGSHSQLGRAWLAEPGSQVGKRMVDRTRSRSEVYGTQVEITGGIGYVRAS